MEYWLLLRIWPLHAINQFDSFAFLQQNVHHIVLINRTKCVHLYNSENEIFWSVNPGANIIRGLAIFRSAWCDRACRWRRRWKPAGSSRRRRSPEPASRSTPHCRFASPVQCRPSSIRRRKARWAGARTGNDVTTTATAGRRQTTAAVGPTMTMLQ